MTANRNVFRPAMLGCMVVAASVCNLATAQTVIDFEGLGLAEGDAAPAINGVTFSADIAVQGGAAFGFGVDFGDNDTGNAPPFSNVGNVFITNPGGFASPETSKVITIEFPDPVTELSFLAADIDSEFSLGVFEQLTAEVFDVAGNLLAAEVFDAPTSGADGDGDVVLIQFGSVAGIRTLVITDALNPPTGDHLIGFGIDNLSFGVPEPSTGLDIKPGSCPNSFNRNSHGVLPVSLLGSDTFDVTEVDQASIQLCRADGGGGCVAPHAGPPGPHSEFDDTGTPFDGELCDCHELTGDGITDLSMKFKTDELVSVLAMGDFSPGALVELTLSGETLDGTPFEASDCVRLVPPGSPPGLLAVLQPGVGQAYVEVSPLDDQLDSGGFGDFERTFPQSTVSTLEAPNAAGEKKFIGWKLDAVFATTDFTFGVTVEGTSQTIEAVYRLPGDIIADDLVNLVDFAQFANCYGQNAPTASCAAEFHAASDLNRDGQVDLLDFSIFALNFGH